MPPMVISEALAGLEARQQPEYPDPNELESVLRQLAIAEHLVTPQATDLLTQQLGTVANGEAVLLQAGSCAEAFDDPPDAVRNFLNVVLPMTATLLASGSPVVKVGRAAGQYAKPRSSPTETRDGVTLPSYKGDIINGLEFTAEARCPNPQRMLTAYDHSAKSLRDIAELTTGGFADLKRMHEWNVRFAAASSQAERYQVIADDIQQTIRFIEACGVRVDMLSALHQAEMFTSHEALLLIYELALTRAHQDRHYGSSAHMLWIGDRTRDPDGAHVAYAALISNPIEVKIGPSATEDELLALCRRLNPKNIPGRLTLISRMGQATIRETLPTLIQSVRNEGTKVIWACDPMHGNTETTESGHKTRRFDNIVEEVEDFMDICDQEGVWAGGFHLEITGENATECLGGSEPHKVEDLSENYATKCDPRLNPTQSIELAFRVAEHQAKSKL